MKAILVNYNADPSWIPEYFEDYIIYDRSDSLVNYDTIPKSKIVFTENLGHCDYDKLTYLYEHYDDLPEVFFWGKVNLWKHISKEEFEPYRNAKEFIPLLSQKHPTYGDERGCVCYYENGMYYERNDSWYVNVFPYKYKSFNEFADAFMIPKPDFLPFAPGGNYILTKERVHRYGRDFYDRLRKCLPYCQLPAEAQMCERSYYLLWK